MAQPTNETREDELQIDSDLYLSEIDDLDLVASNETIPHVGLTSISHVAVEPTAQAKSNSSSELFPHSPHKVGGPYQVKSQIVVVNAVKSPIKTKNPSYDSRDKRHHRKGSKSASNNNNNNKKPLHDLSDKKRHRKSHTSNPRDKRADVRERNQKKLRVAIDKVKQRAEKAVPVRSVQFIANPPIDKHPIPRLPSQPVFNRLGPLSTNPLIPYHIPKICHASTKPTKLPPHSEKSTASKPPQQPKSVQPAKTASEPLHENLNRTQIKNRNRRLAVKRMRAQLKQLQQSK